MKIFIGSLLLLGVVSLSILIYHPRSPKNPANIQKIEDHIRRAVSQNTPPGLSIVVTKDDEIVYNSAFGIADKPNQRPTSSDTIYHWWSITKIPTAIAILQLKDAGLLNIDDPVSQYLPYFKTTLDGEPAPEITIRQLLRHTSGLPDSMPAMIGWVHYEDEIYDQTALLQQYLPEYSQLKFAPDSDIRYSNLGYLVLGAIIEKASGQTYQDYIQDQVLNPLGMKKTSFLYDHNAADTIAAGSHPLFSAYTPLLPFLLDMNALVKQRIGATYWFNPVYIDVTPSTGLIGPAGDIALLAQALLSKQDILSKSSHALLQPQGEAVLEKPLGWPEYDLGDRPWVQHRGGGPGFATLLRLYPEENLAIVIMANSTNLPADDLVNALSQINWNRSHINGETK